MNGHAVFTLPHGFQTILSFSGSAVRQKVCSGEKLTVIGKLAGRAYPYERRRLAFAIERHVAHLWPFQG